MMRKSYKIWLTSQGYMKVCNTRQGTIKVDLLMMIKAVTKGDNVSLHRDVVYSSPLHVID